jgi:hypothetical protein
MGILVLTADPAVVDGRRQQERSWVDGRIDRRLQTEMAQARQGALSPR